MTHCFLVSERPVCTKDCQAWDPRSKECKLLLAADAVTNGVIAFFRVLGGAPKKHPSSPPPPEVKK